MKAISIRNVPDNVYTALQEIAKANHRSLQEQIRFILDQEIRLVKGTHMSTAANWREKLEGRNFSDVVDMVREDRER